MNKALIMNIANYPWSLWKGPFSWLSDKCRIPLCSFLRKKENWQTLSLELGSRHQTSLISPGDPDSQGGQPCRILISHFSSFESTIKTDSVKSDTVGCAGFYTGSSFIQPHIFFYKSLENKPPPYLKRLGTIWL